MKEIANKQPVLKDFSPVLRKLATYMIENRQYDDNLNDLCERIGIKNQAVRQAIYRCNKKGINFYDYLHNQRNRRLKMYGMYVDNALVKGAISGSSKLIELYYKKQGEIIDKQQIDHNIKAKIVVFSPTPGIIPEDIREKRERERDKDGVQIIDTTFDED